MGMFIFQVEEDKVEKLSENIQQGLRYVGKAMQCIDEMRSGGMMGQRMGGSRGGNYGMMGERRWGNQYGGGYTNRRDYDYGQEMEGGYSGSRMNPPYVDPMYR